MIDRCMQARVSLVSEPMVASVGDMTERMVGSATDITSRMKANLSIVCNITLSPYIRFAPIGGFRLKGGGYFNVLKKKK